MLNFLVNDVTAKRFALLAFAFYLLHHTTSKPFASRLFLFLALRQ
jgi:hypothetical protein